MNSVHRAALGVVLALAPLGGTGCISISPRMRPTPPAMVCNDTINAARLAESHGNLSQAIQLYELAHQQNPRNAECLHRLGVVSTLLNQNERAEFYYREAYKLTPINAELLADMGYSAFMRSDFEKSEAFLQQSYQLNNRDPRTITNLGIALAWRGKDDASLAMFRLVGSDVESRQRLASIQTARGGKISDRPDVQMAANATNPNSSVPETAVRTTSFDGASPTINLSRPLQTDSRSELSLPSPEPKKPVESFNLPSLSTTIVMPATPIELPAPMPFETSGLSVEPIPLSSPSDELANTLMTIPIEIPLLPVPPIDSDIESAPGKVTLQSGSTNGIGHSAIAPGIEPNRFREVPKMLKSIPSNTWRKTREAKEEAVEPVPTDTVLPVIQQMSATFETTEIKKPTHGICVVALLEEMRPVSGLKQFEAEYQSQLYRFSSQEALEKFRSNPRKYVPAAGGVDVVSVRNDQEATQGTYNFAIRFQRRLYLFASRQNAEAFRRDPSKYVAVD